MAGLELRILLFPEFFFLIPVFYLGVWQCILLALPPFLPVPKQGVLSFISGCFHINVVSNLDACCFLILSPGGLAVPCSPSPRAWHQHIPAAQSQGAPVTQTALQTRRRRAARVTVKPTTLTLRECQLLR